MRKSSEDAIMQVFEGLRDIDAPVGMKGRILDGLKERAAARSRWAWWPIPMCYLVSGAAFAGVVIFALTAPGIRKIGRAPVQPKIAVAPMETAPAPFKVAAEGAKGSPRELDVQQTRRENAHGTELMRTADSVALSATFAPSMLAPPMPLTEQEKLLLRMAHRSDPVELAMLDSKLRAVEDIQEKAEFQRFFERPTAKHVMTDQSTTEQAATVQSKTEQTAPPQSTPEQEAAPKQQPTEQLTPEQSTTEQLAPGN